MAYLNYKPKELYWKYLETQNIKLINEEEEYWKPIKPKKRIKLEDK